MRFLLYKPPAFAEKNSTELRLSAPALLELSIAVLAKGRPIRFCARGWSMTPFIRDGDVITIQPLRNKTPGVGSIVAFVRPDPDRLVVHRVIARKGNSTFIKGDNGDDYVDGIIPVKNILGLVSRIERNGRYIKIGIGKERLIIAWFSRTRLLIPARKMIDNLRRRFGRAN